MEISKNIYCDTDKVVANSNIKITYANVLASQDKSNDIFIHYGFGSAWENVKTQKMHKTEDGYEISIAVLDSDTLNFCFRDSEDGWDNNDGQNYSIAINPQEISDDAIPSLKEDIDESQESALVQVNHLSKLYMFNKRIRLLLYKIIKFVPKLVTGNFKKKKEDAV